LPLMLLGPAVKSIFGILVLISALKYWPEIFKTLFVNSMDTADHLLHLAQ
jgi:flagellar biosynthesis protein FliR